MEQSGVCVFDLDNTLGDFRIIDFFGLLYEPTCILGFPDISNDTRNSLKKHIDYSPEIKEQLQNLRDSFETALDEKGYNKYMLRPKLKDILSPLVKQYKNNKIIGFIIYSNNANKYALTYAGRAIQNMFNEPNLFIHYIDRKNSIRDEHDSKDGEGYRTKTLNTIKKAAPQIKDEKILFMDDLVHDDLMNSNITYIHLPTFTSNVDNDELPNIWDLFLSVLNKYPDLVLPNLYHVNTYLKCNTLEDIKNRYLNYSKMNEHDQFQKNTFQENLTNIKSKISQFVNASKGGKRKTRRFKTSRKKAHKKKYENTIE